MVYKGYVSECSWHQSKPTAHLLFALAQEGIAAALTMQMVTRIAAHKLQLGYEPTGLADSSNTLPRLELRVGVSSHMCDMLTPDEVTGRLVRGCSPLHSNRAPAVYSQMFGKCAYPHTHFSVATKRASCLI
jgi:hypothetical protein